MLRTSSCRSARDRPARSRAERWSCRSSASATSRWGIVRNRVFANTYGAGAELDAYNAAFRIPEIALDVLVAAGLTAPFVPIFSAAHGAGDDRAANDFGRTVLTAAVLVMAIASAVLFFIAAPWLAEPSARASIRPTRTSTSS